MRSFLVLAAFFVAAGVGITVITNDKSIILETWQIVLVTVVLSAVWSIIERMKK